MSPNETAKANPSYREVCTGTTGHVEVLNVELTDKGANQAMFEELIKFTFSILTQFNCTYHILQFTSTIISISQAILRGKELVPIAARACLPLSPKTSTIKSENPLITSG